MSINGRSPVSSAGPLESKTGDKPYADERFAAKSGRILTSRLDDVTALRRLVTFAFALLRRGYGCVERQPQPR